MPNERLETIALREGGSMRALLVLPDGTAPPGGWPAVIAIHDILGFSPDIQRIARRFADSGYAALAPALFDGAGAPVLCVVRTLRDAVQPGSAAYGRLDQAKAFLAGRPGVNGARVGVTGFCMGGGFALAWAAQGGFRVCAPYYGGVPEHADSLRRVCPVVAGFGERDGPFLAHASRLESHLNQLGIAHDVKLYPGVGHGYMNDHGGGLLSQIARRTPMHAAYDENAAEDSWRRMLAFFGEHL